MKQPNLQKMAAAEAARARARAMFFTCVYYRKHAKHLLWHEQQGVDQPEVIHALYEESLFET